MATPKIELKIYRKIKPVSFQYGLQLHPLDNIKINGDSPQEIADECFKYSLDSNDSTSTPDKNLYFMFVKNDLPVAYGSPIGRRLVWDEFAFRA